MNLASTADRAPCKRAFPRIGISWFFPDHGGTLNCIMTLILSNLHGMLPDNQRIRKRSKDPKIPKNMQKNALELDR